MKRLLKMILPVCLIAILAVSSVFLFAGCKDEAPEGYYVDQTLTMRLDAPDVKEWSVITLAILAARDSNKSKIILRPDGTITIALVLLDVNAMIQSLAPNLKLSDMDIKALANQHVYTIFPGFSTDDIEGSLALLKNSLGIEIVGLSKQSETPGVKEMIEELETTGTISTLTIPPNFGIEFNGSYHLKDVTSPVTGKTYTAVYVGNPDPDSEPFIIMTLSTTDKGKQRVDFRIELLDLAITAIEK